MAMNGHILASPRPKAASDINWGVDPTSMVTMSIDRVGTATTNTKAPRKPVANPIRPTRKSPRKGQNRRPKGRKRGAKFKYNVGAISAAGPPATSAVEEGQKYVARI